MAVAAVPASDDEDDVQALVASARAAPAAADAWSCACWSATSVAWSFCTSALEAADVPLPLGVEVLAEAADDEDDVEVDAEDDWADSSEARVAWAEANEAWASMTAVWSELGSRVARTCPAATCWPTDTSTVPTVPATANTRSACCTGVTVPIEEMVASTFPVSTAAVR